MNLDQIVRQLDIEILTPQMTLDDSPEIVTGYVSDLLSDVLAHAPRHALLITVQVHMNVIAVAMHAELSGIIFAHNRRPDPAVLEKSIDEKIPLFTSKESSFDIVGRLYQLGLRGPGT